MGVMSAILDIAKKKILVGAWFQNDDLQSVHIETQALDFPSQSFGLEILSLNLRQYIFHLYHSIFKTIWFRGGRSAGRLMAD